MKSMRVLFVHQNFPGQYKCLAPAVCTLPGTQVVALGMVDRPPMPGIRYIKHEPERGSTPGIHRLANEFEAKVIRGQSAARAALRLRSEGFQPDVICGHQGWGETLFLKDVWPNAKILSFVEFNYDAHNADVDFDPEFPSAGFEGRFSIRTKNAHNLIAYDNADWLISPTHWQASSIPPNYRHRLSIIHDGVDTDSIRPNPDANVTLRREGVMLRAGDEVVTFVNRNFEPYRGFHIFMRALPEIMAKRPKARIVLVGASGKGYGVSAADGRSYREIYFDEVKNHVDISRIHFVGQVPYAVYLSLLQVSAAHVYLTYPFVLSWSLVEAMSTGCLVIGSATQPVQEIVRHQENGILVDFFSPQALSRAVIAALRDPESFRGLKTAARETAMGYDFSRVCYPKHLGLIEALAGGSDPIAKAGSG